MTARRHFPLHNNEPELIDYFASPLGISKSICPASGIQTRQNVFEPFPEIDAVFFACRGERIQDSETLSASFTAGKEALLSDDRNSSTIFLFFRKILSTSKWRIFRVSKGGAFSLLEKFSGRNLNFILPQKRV